MLKKKNNMITEDYISFETAKLLKEKGFDENTPVNYFIGDDKPRGCVVGEMIYHKKAEEDTHLIDCPTLQMVMKWLREVHNLHIFTIPRWEDVEYMPGEWEEQMTGYQYVIIDIGGTNRNINQSVANRAITPESSYEAAIKHCLENLI